jgi:hypothetical protein
VIDEHAVAAVEQALGDRVEQLERRNNGAGRKHLDLEVAAGHVVDLLGVVDRVFVEDVLRRPRALPAHADRAGLSLDGRSGDGRGGGYAGAENEAAAVCGLGGFRLCTHQRIPPWVAPARGFEVAASSNKNAGEGPGIPPALRVVLALCRLLIQARSLAEAMPEA